jgi:hypothetical protein
MGSQGGRLQGSGLTRVTLVHDRFNYEDKSDIHEFSNTTDP